jgi:hypothetical protein
MCQWALKAAIWAPMPFYLEQDKRWNMYYVADCDSPGENQESVIEVPQMNQRHPIEKCSAGLGRLICECYP